MKVTDQLKDEHNEIELMLQILGRVSEKLESGTKINPKHLDQILEFIKIFADKCHHTKEEEVLFPAMEEASSRPSFTRLSSSGLSPRVPTRTTSRSAGVEPT